MLKFYKIQNLMLIDERYYCHQIKQDQADADWSLRNYLAQQADPSSGCAQQAPLFSSSLLLGAQQAAPLAGVEQQEDAAFAGDGLVSLFF